MLTRLIDKLALWWMRRMCQKYVIGDYLDGEFHDMILCGNKYRKNNSPTIQQVLGLYDLVDHIRDTLSGHVYGQYEFLDFKIPKSCGFCRVGKEFCDLAPEFYQSEMCLRNTLAHLTNGREGFYRRVKKEAE